MDELDRILEAEPTLEPSSGLSASIMEAMRHEASTPPPLRFPWMRFLLGTGASFIAVVSVVVAVRVGVFGAETVTRVSPDWGELAANPMVTALTWTAAALLLSYASWALSRRLVV